MTDLKEVGRHQQTTKGHVTSEAHVCPRRWISSSLSASYTFSSPNCGRQTLDSWTHGSSTGNCLKSTQASTGWRQNLATLCSNSHLKFHFIHLKKWKVTAKTQQCFCFFVFIQEAAQIHVTSHASVWRPLHSVHGFALHRGWFAAVADPNALWDDLQFLPGEKSRLKTSTLSSYLYKCQKVKVKKAKFWSNKNLLEAFNKVHSCRLAGFLCVNSLLFLQQRGTSIIA